MQRKSQKYSGQLRRLSLFLGAFKSVFYSRFKNGYPFFVSHLITVRCFAKCPTCLWRGEANEERDTGKIIEFYRQAKQEGFVSTTFWGGEPLLRGDLFEILGVCRNMGIVCGLITNGYLLPKYAEQVAANLDFLIVSIDFPSAEEHDRYRGVTGLFNNSLEGIQSVKKLNPELKIFLNSVISSMNYTHVITLIQLAENLGTTITFESVNTGKPQFRRDENEDVIGLRLAKEMEQKVFQQICALKKRHKCINNSNSYLNLFAIGNVKYRCHAPKISIRVEPDGNVTNCRDRKNPIGNVYKEQLHDILTSKKMKMLQRSAESCCSCVDSGVVESSLFWDLNFKTMIDMFRLFLR